MLVCDCEKMCNYNSECSKLGALHSCCIRDRKTKSALNASRHRLKSYSLLTLFTPNIQYPHTHTHAPIHSLTSHMQAHTCAWARVQLSPVFRAFMLFLQDLNKIPYVSGDELTSFRGGRNKKEDSNDKNALPATVSAVVKSHSTNTNPTVIAL